MRKLCLLLTSVTLLYSCSNNKEIASEEEIEISQELYLGIWKLVNASYANILTTQFGGFLTLDYSNHDVFFEFNAEKILKISGKMDNHPDWDKNKLGFLFIDEGTYIYSMKKEESWLFSIDDNKYGYDLRVQKDNSMSIGMIGLGSLSFEKVKK